MSRMPVVLAVFAAACNQGRESTVGRDQATVADSAGITIVQNHRPVWGEGGGWRVSAEPVLVVDDEAALGHGKYVTSAARLSNGELVVLSDIGGRWLTAAGALIRPFASLGDGPGEFRYADQLLVLPGDTIVVASPGYRAKIAVFGPDGSLVRDSHRDLAARQALGQWQECREHLLPDLSTTGCRYDPSIPFSDTYRNSYDSEGRYVGPGSGLLRDMRRTWRVSPAQDSAFALGIDIGVEQQVIDIPAGHGTSIIHPFHSESYLAHGGSPYLIAIATNPHWEIELWTPDGKLDRKVRRDGGRRIPTTEERREAERMIDDSSSYVIRPLPGASREQLRSLVEWPDSMPGHAGLVMTADGIVLSRQFRLWASGDPSVYDVIDLAGRWLGSIELPARFRLLEVGRDYLLGVQFDEDDLPSVVVYGLDRSEGG